MPLYGNMTLLQKVFYWDESWLNDTPTAFLDPVTLRAGVSLPIHSLEDKWLEALFLAEKFLPVVLAPPELVLVQILATAFQDVVSKRPNLLVHSKTTWLRW